MLLLNGGDKSVYLLFTIMLAFIPHVSSAANYINLKIIAINREQHSYSNDSLHLFNGLSSDPAQRRYIGVYFFTAGYSVIWRFTGTKKSEYKTKLTAYKLIYVLF